MRGLDAPDKMKVFSSSMQWIIEPSQCFVNIDSLTCQKMPLEQLRRHGLTAICTPSSPKLYFFSAISFTIFQLRGQKCRTSSCRHCPSTSYIYIYICMYILIDMLRRTNHAPRRRMHSVANACHFMYMNREEPSSMRLLYHEE